MYNPESAGTSVPLSAPGARRRESARAVIQRLHATPVQLFPWRRDADSDATASRPLHDVTSGASSASPPPPPSSSTPSSNPRHAMHPPSSTAEIPGCDVKTELGPSSVCVLTTSAAQAPAATALGGPLGAAAGLRPLQQHAYAVAAAHALRGGSVLLLRGPASGPSFSLAGFTLEVEQQWVLSQNELRETPNTADAHDRPKFTSVPSASVAAEQLRARQQAVMAAVGRVEVLACASLADVYAVCHAYTFPRTTAASLDGFAAVKVKEEKDAETPQVHETAVVPPASKASAELGANLSPEVGGSARAAACADGNQAIEFSADALRPRAVDVVPLCVVEGLTGPLTFTTLQERSTGHPTPISHYLLCLLQRRLQCALLVLEMPLSTATVASESRSANGSYAPPLQRFPTAHPAPGGGSSVLLPPTESVLGDSDLIARLRVPHEHPQCASPRGSRGGGGGRESAGRRSLGAKTRRGEAYTSTSSLAEQWTPPPISLHNIHLCVVYVEVGCDGFSTELSASPDWMCPHGLALRSRLHLMRTSLSEAERSTRGSVRVDYRGDDVGEGGFLMKDGFGGGGGGSSSECSVRRSLGSGGGGWNGGAWSARSSRRNSTALAPTYLGSWVYSTEWRKL